MAQPRPLDLDVLPEQYHPRRVTLRMVLGALVVVATMSGLIPLYRLFDDQRAQIAAAQVRLDQAQAALGQAQVDQAELESLSQQIEQVHAEIARIREEAGVLGEWRVLRSDGVATAVSTLVPRVEIRSVAQDEARFVVSGRAGSQTLVLDYARALQASGQFTNVRILSLLNTDPLGLAPEVEFAILMEQ